MKEVTLGYFTDSPGLGGARVPGLFTTSQDVGAEHECPSPEYMACRSWFKKLIAMEDTAPNKPKLKGSVQMDFIQKHHLYDEYLKAMKDAKEKGALSYDRWINVWNKDFDCLAIVEFKNVDSKVHPLLSVD